jgi:flavin reductase (DIM6/NTAB) family NADH-FMN oxidoreductase RutF
MPSAAAGPDVIPETGPAGISPARLREAMGHFATGVTVITSVSAGGGAGRHDGDRRGPTGSPRLDGVLAMLECTVEHALPGGDHEIIVGRVRHAETSGHGAPLVFWRGRYAPLGDSLPA